MSPEKPRIAGELRLRVTSSDDAASFKSGSDLFRLNGQPWSRPLLHLSKHHPDLYENLREDGLIPDDLDTALAALPSESWHSRLFYTLNDTFLVDFSSTKMNFLVVTEQGVERETLFDIFPDFRRHMAKRRPYTGAYTSHTSRCSYIDYS